MRWTAIGLCLIMGTLAGCVVQPPAIQRGAALRTEAYARYAENNDRIVSELLTLYRDTEKVRADGARARDLRAFLAASQAATTEGKPYKAQDVLDTIRAIDADHAKHMALVDARLLELASTIQESRKDLVVAAQLDDVIRQYHNAGLDPDPVADLASQVIERLRKGK